MSTAPSRAEVTAAKPPRARARPRRQPWLAPLVFTLCALPLAKLAFDAAFGRLGSNPVAEGLNHLGFWTLTLLALSLAPTPAHDFLGLTWPLRVRRMVGLFAFTYGALHFAWYVGLDQFFAVREILADVGTRKFITVGFAALVLLVPLAVTSTNAWVKRLGFRRWKRLHRLVYVAAALGVVHFLWRVKADHREPLLFAAVIGALLALRVVARVKDRPRRGAGAAAPRKATSVRR